MAWKKLCPGCDKEKDLSEFHPKYAKWKRRSRSNKYCNDCLYPPNQEARSATIMKTPWHDNREM